MASKYKYSIFKVILLRLCIALSRKDVLGRLKVLILKMHTKGLCLLIIVIRVLMWMKYDGWVLV